MTTTSPESASKYVANARHYLMNAILFLDQGETSKATEMLWGSMAAAVKALAAARKRSLNTHRDVREYAREVARQLGDETLLGAFRDAEGMHSNFYETRLSADDVAQVLPGIRAAVAKLLSLISPDAAEGTARR